MNEGRGLTFRVEWEDAGSVRAPELRATWSRLEMWVQSKCVTTVEETDSGVVRRSIFVPLYPLAEWAAYNWWYLRTHSRPAALPSRQWSYRHLSRFRSSRFEWLRHHNFRAVGEGFPWPDLTIVPEGEFSQVVWSSSDQPSGGLRYLASGGSLISTLNLESVLTDLVESTLTRLDEFGVGETQLHKEWRAIQSLDSEEVAFCESAARLGLDPFDVDEAISDSLEAAGDKVPINLLSDFLNAVDPKRIREGMAWIGRASRELALLTDPSAAEYSRMENAVRETAMPRAGESPWTIGYQQARRARETLGLGDAESFPIQALVAATTRSGPSGQVDGIGVGIKGVKLVLTRRSSQPDVRFASARALWHALSGQGGAPFLLTHARTYRQKIERAFAAELLAPASGIEGHLDESSSPSDAHVIDSIARTYGVGPLVVQHQIENNLMGAPV